jgi:hypothetical protein
MRLGGLLVAVVGAAITVAVSVRWCEQHGAVVLGVVLLGLGPGGAVLGGDPPPSRVFAAVAAVLLAVVSGIVAAVALALASACASIS